MFNFITSYIDRKVTERFEKENEELDRKRGAIKSAMDRKINDHLPRAIIDRVDNLLHAKPKGSVFESQHAHPKLKRVYKELGRVIKTRFREELEKLRKRRETLNTLESQLKEIVEDHTNEHVSSEEFVDQIVERINRKQV